MINCPLCKGKPLIFYKNNKQPLFSQGLVPNRNKKFMRKQLLSLAVCRECSYVFNMSRDLSKLDKLYRDYYTYLPQDSSSLNVDFLKKLAKSLSKNHATKKVLEVGSHDGYFLKLLFDFGWDVAGVDPSPISKTAVKKYNFDIKENYFSSNLYKDKKFNLLVARHVLEHIDDPIEFLLDFKKVLTKKGRIYIEAPSLAYMVEKKNYQDIHFEHLSYFTFDFLKKLISNCGFEIVNSKRLQSNRVISILAENKHSAMLTRKKAAQRIREAKSNKSLVQKLLKFGRESEKRRLNMLNFIHSKLGKGDKWVVFGAGAGSVNLISSLGLTEKEILFVVDSDLKKWGKYLPGSGLFVKSPKALKKTMVDVVFVTSDFYQNEIVRSLDWFAKNGGKIVALHPRFGYVKK